MAEPTARIPAVRDVLLTRRGLAFVSTTGPALSETLLRAVELEIAAVGYVLATRLSARLRNCTLDELVAFRAWAVASLLSHSGGDQKHEPLFRGFPDGIPDDTLGLWWNKVLVHFLQAPGRPCLYCRATGTTHVLAPCRHVVCDRCFDGASYTACPICEHHVDRASPFFLPAPGPEVPREKVTFKLLDLGESIAEQTRSLFTGLCERAQALSPADREALLAVLCEQKSAVLAWLPPRIPVRENVAVVFGTLFRTCDPAEVLPYARRYMSTATDVLRFIAVLSGKDGSLLAETVFETFERLDGSTRFWGHLAELLGASGRGVQSARVTVPVQRCRFKVARLSRPLRRTLLSLLEGLQPDALVEDMLRHRSYWVWVGEFLHPHEYAAKLPNVARAFQVLRGKAPDGTPAPRFKGFSTRVEEAVRARDSGAMVALLSARPGELARRYDHLLRLAGDDAAAVDGAVAAFARSAPAFSTPVLLALHNHLPRRSQPASVRVFFPRGMVTTGVSSPDSRALLPDRAIGPSVRAIDAELLRRFATKERFAGGLIDRKLESVLVPFNERTASAAAVQLPRGSRIAVEPGKLVRHFLHWCQPEEGGFATDLDLSLSFYDAAWQHVGVCSFYQLKLAGKGGVVLASSAGDLRDAPWPDGATELVDLHRLEALAAGLRYAVMVVNNYGGMPFSQLERGFAGVMLRDDSSGQHFDPRTVELRFALNGANGVFLPFVLDLKEGVLHWLDVHARGLELRNTVETSNSSITRICPSQMAYFASGTRTSMFELALLHAAARCDRVWIRGEGVAEYVRRPGEDAAKFYARMAVGKADESRSQPPGAEGPPLLAVLYRGDTDLPKGSAAYALFRERVTPSLSASDLLS